MQIATINNTRTRIMWGNCEITIEGLLSIEQAQEIVNGLSDYEVEESDVRKKTVRYNQPPFYYSENTY